MCGIHVHISRSYHKKLDAQDAELLSRRGPDAMHTHQTVIETGIARWCLTFTSSVLSLRGNSLQTQPIVDDSTSSVLCWNGEAWSFDDAKVHDNDTQTISKHLFNAVTAQADSERAVADVLGRITGPFGFVFFDAVSHKLYFGRDVLGRRSLLINDTSSKSGELTISSVAANDKLYKAREVNTTSLTVVDLSKIELILNETSFKFSLPSINRNVPAESHVSTKTPSQEAVSNLTAQLRSSVQTRVEEIPTYTASGSNFSPSRIAVLFSGGLDCTLLARLTHDILPYNQPIDLLNVAFENPRVLKARTTSKSTTTTPDLEVDTYESCPDRMTGRSSFAELVSVCPERAWRFVAINIPYTEYVSHKATILRLMHPHNTEMDLSITSALYFAARGQGVATISLNMRQLASYTTTARVLLSGLGADELFGGYARHAAAFARGGFQALNDELEVDFTRIGSRNLGRDDRVIAHWGRETRYPFLDEKFVKFSLNLPAWEKCGFRPDTAIPKHFETTTVPKHMEELHPEKMLLRCALWQLGMPGASAEKKRAIQFGARTAKMHAGKTKGTDIISIDDALPNET